MERNCSKYHAAIDIGTQNVIILVGKILSTGKIQIVAKSLVEVAKDSVKRGEVKSYTVVGAINSALDVIRTEYSLEIKSAYISLSGQHIESIEQHGYEIISNAEGAVEEADLEKLTLSMFDAKVKPGNSIISVLPKSYIIDNVVQTMPIGMLAERIDVVFNLVCCDDKCKEFLTNTLSKCGIKIENIILSSIASSRAVLYDGEQELGVIVVDIGAGTTDVAVYLDNNLIYLGVIPIGGDIINKDIRTIGIMSKHAESLITNHGNALASSVDPNIVIELPTANKHANNEISKIVISNIIQARIYDILVYLAGIVNSLEIGDKLNSGVVITGGVAKIENIDKLFKKYFKCPVRIASPTDNVDEVSEDLLADSRYSTAVGLLIEGIDNKGQSRVEEYDCSVVNVNTSKDAAVLADSLFPTEEEPEEEGASKVQKQKNSTFLDRLKKIGNGLTDFVVDKD